MVTQRNRFKSIGKGFLLGISAVALLIASLGVSTEAHAKKNQCEKVFGEADYFVVPYSTPREAFQAVFEHLNKNVLGMEPTIKKILVSLLTNGHVLLSGPPGVAKSRLAEFLAMSFKAEVKTELFTVDTSPEKLIGMEVWNPKKNRTKFQPGLLFTNFLVAEELNRAPPKTQTALLSAMGSGYVTIKGKQVKLPSTFMVIASINPHVEGETFALLQSELDRILFNIPVDYAENEKLEKQILELIAKERVLKANGQSPHKRFASLETIEAARREIELMGLQVPENVRNYVLKIIDATRNPRNYPMVSPFVDHIVHGVSSRATIGLEFAATAVAWLDGRSEATTDDVDFIAKDVLRHRIVLGEDAEAQGVFPDRIIDAIIRNLNSGSQR